MIIKCRNRINNEILFSSTTYQSEFFDKCVYCHKDVENDFFEYEGEFIGQPYRCDCEHALDELKAKEQLYLSIKSLEANIDVELVNNKQREFLIGEINRAYEEEHPTILDYLLK